MVKIDVCLSDLPKGAMKKSDKNGKIYIQLICDKRKEVGKFKETHTLYVSQSKEERTAKTPKVYVGSGEEYIFNEGGERVDDMPPANLSDAPDDDLPF